MKNPQYPIFEFDNSFAAEMEGFYVALEAEPASDPGLVLFNEPLAIELKLDPAHLESDEGIAIFAGNSIPQGASPLAQAYAGLQFGGFSPSLGDGRAILLGEVIDAKGQRRDLQLKGSGCTPFSRNGDGKATLGPVLREYIMSEAMHALGIPTTRSLAAVLTGDEVFREKPLPGAVLTRVAASHIRVGTFQFFAARGATDKVQQLADYAIARHAPDAEKSETRHLDFFDHVIEHQVQLVANWMAVGFIHGVMNTDNMTISGETIDYGPCAFMDVYHPDTVFSSIDDHGRYAYRMQPVIAQWNLARLAECLLPLFYPDDNERAVEIATEKVETIPARYEEYWLSIMRRKLGLSTIQEDDKALVEDFHTLMADGKADFNLTFRRLADVLVGEPQQFLENFDSSVDAGNWLERWQARISKQQLSFDEIVSGMHSVNPLYLPRNHHVEHALDAAVSDQNFEPLHALLDVLSRPFDSRDGFESYETASLDNNVPYVTYCGT